MADNKPITGFAADTTPKSTDVFVMVDTTDTSSAPTGTTKKMTQAVRSASGIYKLPTTNVTGTSQLMVANNVYIANNAGLVTLTVAATLVIGDEFIVIGNGAGGWKISMNTGQLANIGPNATARGVAGFVSSLNRYDCIKLKAISTTDLVAEYIQAALLTVG